MNLNLFHVCISLVLDKFSTADTGEILEGNFVYPMEVYLSFHLIVKIFNYESVLSVRVLVRANVFVHLHEFPESLRHISAHLGYDIRKFCDWLSLNFSLYISLII